MDNLSPIYDTPKDGLFNFQASDERNLSYFQLYSLLQELMSAMDIPSLMKNYFHQLTKQLPLTGVTLHYPQGTQQVGKKSHQTVARQVFKFSNDVILRYYGPSRLNEHHNAVLTDFHQCLEMPLKIAIEHEQVRLLCFKDPLTGLGNRGQFDDYTSHLMAHADRGGAPFSLVVLDLDKFKQANDQFGHQLGDQILIAFAGVLNTCLRDTDYAFRLGGDEFCCLLENANQLLNQKVSIRIINAVSNHPLLAKHNITCSIGSALLEKGDNIESLFKRADMAMYTAKQAGKNCAKCA